MRGQQIQMHNPCVLCWIRIYLLYRLIYSDRYVFRPFISTFIMSVDLYLFLLDNLFTWTALLVE